MCSDLVGGEGALRGDLEIGQLLENDEPPHQHDVLGIAFAVNDEQVVPASGGAEAFRRDGGFDMGEGHTAAEAAFHIIEPIRGPTIEVIPLPQVGWRRPIRRAVHQGPGVFGPIGRQVIEAQHQRCIPIQFHEGTSEGSAHGVEPHGSDVGCRVGDGNALLCG